MHHVGVVEPPHQLYFVLKTVTALLPRILLLLRKGLHCHHFLVPEALCQVHSGKSPLAYLLFGLEQLVEIPLINPLL